MAAVLFDTQKFVKRLQAAKFPPEQAEAQSEAIREVLESAFASHTKEQRDITARTVEALDSKTEKALLALKNETHEQFAKVDTRFAEVKGELILLRWMIGAVFAGIVTLLIRTFTA